MKISDFYIQKQKYQISGYASNMLPGFRHHSCTKSAQSDFRFFS